MNNGANCEDTNFIFKWWKQYFTSEWCEWSKYFFHHKKIIIRWPTRDTLSPCKSIAAPWKLTCSVHFRLFSVQIYRCSVEDRLLHSNIRNFSVQKLSLSVENSMLLRTNRIFLRGKFDISPYKSKASAWKIRCFSVQIESFPVQNSMLLRTNRKRSKASPWKTTQWIGQIRIPPVIKSLKLCFGGGKLGFLSFSRFEMESSCFHCGQHFQENAKFCHSCGEKLLNSKCLKIFFK